MFLPISLLHGPAHMPGCEQVICLQIWSVHQHWLNLILYMRHSPRSNLGAYFGCNVFIFHPTVLHTYQDVSKSFVYKYEAFINTTLPQSGVEFVGQKIICDVELNVLTSEILHMNVSVKGTSVFS